YLLRKHSVCLFECFFRADVIPNSRYLPNIEWRARVHPLYEPTRLVLIVPFVHVLLNQRQRGLRIVIQRDSRQRALWVCWLFFEIGDATALINFYRIVFLDLFQVTHVVNTKHWCVLLTTEFTELCQVGLELVVACMYDNVVGYLLFSD